MSNDEKIFAGSAKVINGKYGDFTKVTFHKDNINTIVQYMKDNQTDFITLDVKEKREAVEGKPTHYLQVSTYKPEEQASAPAAQQSAPAPQASGEIDEMPF